MHQLRIEVTDEDMAKLRWVRTLENRTVRDQASWWVHLKALEVVIPEDADDAIVISEAV